MIRNTRGNRSDRPDVAWASQRLDRDFKYKMWPSTEDRMILYASKY